MNQELNAQAVRQLGPGDLVGEIGVLVSETATADVRALQDMQLLQVLLLFCLVILEGYNNLWALNTSPPRNRSTFMLGG